MYDMLVLAVPHRPFRERSVEDYLRLLSGENDERVFLDVKGVFREALQGRRDLTYWVL